jgi:hypothetical protein
VRATGGVVEIVGANDFVANAVLVEFEDLLLIFAFKDEEVLDSKLLLLGPSNAQSFPFVALMFVQQVEHLLVIDLHERHEHREVFAI